MNQVIRELNETKAKLSVVRASHDALVENLKVANELLARAQQTPLDRRRWEGCERCKSGIPDKGYPHEFWVNDGAIYYHDAECGWEGEMVSYCPFCGRPLTEEAWAELERRIDDGKTN